jgi:hypothetical protein
MDIKKFRTLTIVGVVALWSTMCGPLLHAATITTTVSSTFDTSLDGWILVPASDTGFLQFSGTVGNPPGSALFTDGVGGATGTIRAPLKYLGDWSLVENLQYEHKIIRLGGSPAIHQTFDVYPSRIGFPVNERTHQ